MQDASSTASQGRRRADWQGSSHWVQGSASGWVVRFAGRLASSSRWVQGSAFGWVSSPKVGRAFVEFLRSVSPPTSPYHPGGLNLCRFLRSVSPPYISLLPWGVNPCRFLRSVEEFLESSKRRSYVITISSTDASRVYAYHETNSRLETGRCLQGRWVHSGGCAIRSRQGRFV